MENSEVKEYVGFTPRSYQRDVIKALNKCAHQHRIVTVCAKRQVGKSLLIENILLFFAINYKGTTNFCVSPTLNQARKVYKDIIEAVAGSDILQATNATLLEITLVNRSQIIFKSAEQKDALRGYTCNGITCFDESAYISDEVFYTCTPWVDVHGAPLLIVSTPKTRNGFFYQYYSYGLQGKPNCYTIDWGDEKYKEDIEKCLSPQRLEEYRQMLPRNQFKSEYLGQFLDDDGMVFTNFKENVRINSVKNTDKLYIGIDWANGGGDDTVISGINQKGEQVLLQYWNNLTPVKQIENIYNIIKPLEKQIEIIHPELNSIGTPYTDMLKEKLSPTLKSKLIGFNTTNSSKADLVSALQVAFEKDQIKILDDEKQLSELGTYAAEYNPKTKNVSYNAPSGLHDDLCIGLMLSWDAYKSHSRRGSYNISIV